MLLTAALWRLFRFLYGVVFVVLLVWKVLGNLSWPWLWVMAPLWVPMAAVVAYAVIGTTLVVTSALLEVRAHQRWQRLAARTAKGEE